MGVVHKTTPIFTDDRLLFKPLYVISSVSFKLLVTQYQAQTKNDISFSFERKLISLIVTSSTPVIVGISISHVLYPLYRGLMPDRLQKLPS